MIAVHHSRSLSLRITLRCIQGGLRISRATISIAVEIYRAGQYSSHLLRESINLVASKSTTRLRDVQGTSQTKMILRQELAVYRSAFPQIQFATSAAADDVSDPSSADCGRIAMMIPARTITA